jgi:hypothetical protein
MSYCRKYVSALLTRLALIGFPFSAATHAGTSGSNIVSKNRRSRWYQTELSNRGVSDSWFLPLVRLRDEADQRVEAVSNAKQPKNQPSHAES